MDCRGHCACALSHANEAFEHRWKGMWTYIPVPASEVGMGDCYSQLAISVFCNCMFLRVSVVMHSSTRNKLMSLEARQGSEPQAVRITYPQQMRGCAMDA